MNKLNYLLIGLFLFQLSGFSQSQDFNNGNLLNVNCIHINDPGIYEGIKWLNTSSNWSIDVSPEDRSNADGNLNIYGTADKIMLWRPTVLKGNVARFFLLSQDAPAGSKIWYQAVDNNGSYAICTADDKYTWKESALIIKRNGNVGIGTYDPTAELSVNGLIISSEIKVLADISKYPDFVFSDSYELKSLKEVEKYIAENKHLPEIPKADEVEDGIALGEMNNKLLQKIEELTLYVIEQNNEIERLKEILIKNGIE